MHAFVRRRGPTIAVAVLLFVAGGATVTTAQNLITSADIKNGTIRSADIEDGTIRSADIKSGGVANADLARGAVNGQKIADGSVVAPDLANNAVNSAKIADGEVKAADITNGGVASAEVLDASLTAADVADTNSLTTAEINEAGLEFTAGGDVVGSLGAASLAADSVGNAEMVDDAVGNAEMLDNAVSSDEVSANSLRLTDLAIGITDESSADLFGTVNSGSCSNAFNDGLQSGVAPVGSLTLVFHVRLTSGAVNPGWTIDGLATTTANAGRIRMCNNTGASADPPDLTFSYMTIAP